MGNINNIDIQYLNLVKDILYNGVSKPDRTGTGVISVFSRQIRHKMDEGFPLLTTKKLNFKNIWTELVWFLQGNTNIKWLLEQGNPIWVGDCFKKYQEAWRLDTYGVLEALSQKQFEEKILNNESFAKEWGELGPIYGAQWRKWNGIDQIQNLIKEIQTNPDSRRLMVNAWNVGELNKMVLPPCHYGFQVYTRLLSYEERYKIWFNNNYETGMEYLPMIKPDFDSFHYVPTPTRAISLKWDQRSVDVGLGLPYNIASYALLLLMIAQEVGMHPDELIGNLGDTHIYSNHVDGLTVQLGREPMELPRVKIQDGIYSQSDGDFVLINYESHPHIKLELSN